MKQLNLVVSCTAEGIEEDILDTLGLESIPDELVSRISNRLYQHTRDTKDWVRVRAGTELTNIFDRAFGV